MTSHVVSCSRSNKPHKLATIVGTEQLVLSYCSSVMTSSSDPDAVVSPQDGVHYRRAGAQRELREPLDAAVEIDLWCKSCRTGHPVDARALFGAARAGRNVSLTSRGVWEGLWQ